MICNIERPKNFDQVIGQEMVVENIRNQSIRNHFFSVFVLCGQYGAGKTTISKIIGMAANCKHKDERGNPCGECESCRAVLGSSQEGIIEIDGASNNGVDHIRALLGRAATLGIYDKKVIVIDEAHMLSKSAFNALLITLENPPAHCIFIFCTTEKEALPETVVSRAAVYEFGKIPDDLIQKHILAVAERNDIQISEDAAGLLARHARGAMRNALGLLEQLSLQKLKSEMINSKDVISILGISSVEQTAAFLDGCYSSDVQMVISVVREIERSGHSLRAFIQDVLRMNTDLLYMKSGADIVGSKYYKDKLRELVSIPGTEIAKANRILSVIASTPANYLSADRIIVDVIGVMRSPLEEQKRVVINNEKKESKNPEDVKHEPLIEEQKSPIIETEQEKEDEEDEVISEISSSELKEEPINDEPEEEDDEETDISDLFSFFGGGFMGNGFFGTGFVPDDSTDNKKNNRKKNDEQVSATAVAGAVNEVNIEEGFLNDEDEEIPIIVSAEENKAEEQSEEIKEEDIQENVVLEIEPTELEEQTDFKDSIPVDSEGRITWDEAAELGIVPKKTELKLPKPESKEELEEIYRNIQDNSEETEEDEAMEEQPCREIYTRSDYIQGQEELRKLLQDNGFKILYRKARHTEKNNHIYLYFDKMAYVLAAKPYLLKCKGISAVLEKR